MLQMIDDETGLKMSMAVQRKPKNSRLAESNVFQIVTWTKGLGDAHNWTNRDAFLCRIKTQDYLIYRLRKCGRDTRPALAVMHDAVTVPIGFAFASYDLLRLELGVPGDIGPDEVKRAEDMLLVELLTYEEYLTGQVYTYSICGPTGAVIETRSDIYGEDYADHLATTAFNNHRSGIGAGDA